MKEIKVIEFTDRHIGKEFDNILDLCANSKIEPSDNIVKIYSYELSQKKKHNGMVIGARIDLYSALDHYIAFAVIYNSNDNSLLYSKVVDITIPNKISAVIRAEDYLSVLVDVNRGETLDVISNVAVKYCVMTFSCDSGLRDGVEKTHHIQVINQTIGTGTIIHEIAKKERVLANLIKLYDITFLN